MWVNIFREGKGPGGDIFSGTILGPAEDASPDLAKTEWRYGDGGEDWNYRASEVERAPWFMHLIPATLALHSVLSSTHPCQQLLACVCVWGGVVPARLGLDILPAECHLAPSPQRPCEVGGVSSRFADEETEAHRS